MPVHVKIKRGANIRLKGTAEKVHAEAPTADTFALKPSDFHGLTPKLTVKIGDEVKAGTPLFHDKYNDRIKFTAPVSGEVVEINRGEKRKILDVKILADKAIQYEDFKKADPSNLSREEILEQLLASGTWPMIRQRPYAVVANPEDEPKAIFISAFDSNPLAPDYDFVVHGNEALFQTGLNAVAKLTSGKVHLNVSGTAGADKAFTGARNVEVNTISGPHPAGNVGVQIHHIDPINKGEKVWYLSPQSVITIGRLFSEGRYNASRVVALTGSEVKKPRYYRTLQGTSVKELIKDNLNDGDKRLISGNVLTGTQITEEGYLGFYDDQITAIPEGNQAEFLGWLAPGLKKLSFSRTFFSWLTPGKEYSLNSNQNGELRAFVISGQYEKVFPMNIFPVQLVKAIMTEDIELMEGLGIYEVAPEDFALCEFACTSKMSLQEIVRHGLDIAQKELG